MDHWMLLFLKIVSAMKWLLGPRLPLQAGQDLMLEHPYLLSYSDRSFRRNHWKGSLCIERFRYSFENEDRNTLFHVLLHACWVTFWNKSRLLQLSLRQEWIYWHMVSYLWTSWHGCSDRDMETRRITTEDQASNGVSSLKIHTISWLWNQSL